MKTGQIATVILWVFHGLTVDLLAANLPSSHPAIDALFQRWEKTLPEPTTISEMNGISPKDVCPNHSHNTYGFLNVIAAQVPVRVDSDLAALVKWSRHSDSCIRQIALNAVVQGIGFDRDNLVVPSMNDLEDYHYHHIMVALAQYLRLKKVNYDQSLFDGMFVTVSPEDAHAFATAKWEEDDSPGLNWRVAVEFRPGEFVMSHLTKSDGQWKSEHRTTAKIDGVKITTDQQLMITVSNQTSPDKKNAYMLWPISKDIMWFKLSSSWTWDKFHRVK